MNAKIVTDTLKMERDSAFAETLKEVEKMVLAPLPEDIKALMKFVFNEGWITSTKKLLPILEQSIAQTEALLKK